MSAKRGPGRPRPPKQCRRAGPAPAMAPDDGLTEVDVGATIRVAGSERRFGWSLSWAGADIDSEIVSRAFAADALMALAEVVLPPEMLPPPPEGPPLGPTPRELLDLLGPPELIPAAEDITAADIDIAIVADGIERRFGASDDWAGADDPTGRRRETVVQLLVEMSEQISPSLPPTATTEETTT